MSNTNLDVQYGDGSVSNKNAPDNIQGHDSNNLSKYFSNNIFIKLENLGSDVTYKSYKCKKIVILLLACVQVILITAGWYCVKDEISSILERCDLCIFSLFATLLLCNAITLLRKKRPENVIEIMEEEVAIKSNFTTYIIITIGIFVYESFLVFNYKKLFS